MTLVRRMLKRDHDRHRVWFAVNGILVIASAILAIVPGPNMAITRVPRVGHCCRCAAPRRAGVSGGRYGSPRLSDLSAALTQAPGACQHIQAIAELGCQAAFIERVATR
jgi:hypothetical protein